MNKLLEIALTQYGIKEIVGSNNNKKIVSYFQDLGFDISDDETAWCAAFINWCALKAGFKRTNKLNARSFLEIGVIIELDSIQLGDVVILERGSDWQGHVGIFINRVGNLVYLLGGNQSNMVNITAYSIDKILGIRRLQTI